MSLVTLCAFCEALPEGAPSKAAKTLRCPLCKSDLGVSSSGAKFRLAAVPDCPAVSHRGRNLAVAGGFGACAVLSVAILWWSRPPQVVPVEKSPSPALASPAPCVEEAVEPFTPVEAIAKPQAPSSPAGTVKPPPQSAKPRALVPPASTPPLAQLPPERKTLPPVTKSAAALFEELKRVPEVALHKPYAEVPKKEQARKDTEAVTQRMRSLNVKQEDGFVRELMAERADLAGLPFLLGKACRLEAGAAKNLAAAAIGVREFISLDSRASSARNPGTGMRDVSVSRFWHQRTYGSLGPRGEGHSEHAGQSIAALTQILGDAESGTRAELLDLLERVDHEQATQALIRFALYELEGIPRDRAVTALAHRSPSTYVENLLAGFRHPWPPVARNAAEALVKLQRTEATGKLIDFLEEPDPAAPFVAELQGKKVTAVRELARVNHLRNCQLCHAPTSDGSSLRGLPVGRVPSQAEALPPTFTPQYYGSRDAVDQLVRADITYLRQDFSLSLPVDNAKPWPDMQRFDYLVRTRALSDEEAKNTPARPPILSPQHQAALWALRELTGADFGHSAAAWRSSLPAR